MSRRLCIVIAGLGAAITLRAEKDARIKSGHDGVKTAGMS
jgi:hypothetical protein